MEKQNDFHNDLKLLIDDYINRVYDYSESFPKEELFGIKSQLRRSSLSVMLNYVEGFARQRKKIFKNFIEISYGSMKESKYLLYFSCKREYLAYKEYKELINLSDKIGAMLWGIMKNL